jgi:hypothetical protein
VRYLQPQPFFNGRRGRFLDGRCILLSRVSGSFLTGVSVLSGFAILSFRRKNPDCSGSFSQFLFFAMITMAFANHGSRTRLIKSGALPGIKGATVGWGKLTMTLTAGSLGINHFFATNTRTVFCQHFVIHAIVHVFPPE